MDKMENKEKSAKHTTRCENAKIHSFRSFLEMCIICMNGRPQSFRWVENERRALCVLMVIGILFKQAKNVCQDLK